MAEPPNMLYFERKAWKDHTLVCGVDEAGRGPLAGPVVAAAVHMEPTQAMLLLQTDLSRVNDSKQLSERVRHDLRATLDHHPDIHIGIGQASVAEIDQHNILQATYLAMSRAIQALEPKPQHALVDGRPAKGLPIPHQALVKGDSKSFLIACASIVAKTERDEMMTTAAASYPGYGFDGHKGYGTAAHLKALREHGPCPIHRHSFRPVREAAGLDPEQLDLMS